MEQLRLVARRFEKKKGIPPCKLINEVLVIRNVNQVYSTRVIVLFLSVFVRDEDFDYQQNGI